MDENSLLAVTLEIDEQKATVKLNNFGQKIKLVSDNINKVGGDSRFAGKLTTDFESLEKKVNDVRQSFQEVAKVRLDGGNIGNLSREIVTAQTRARQLASDITNIRKELANPNRSSSIAFLTSELRAAELEAEKLDRKLNSLSGGAAQGAARNLKLSGFQKTNLSYQVNDVLTGLASGQNPSQILAQQGGQIAQIFSPAQITAFSAAYGGLVSILGLGTLAIAATYKITNDLRAEAERRLKAEEMITGAINKQRIAQKEAFQDLEKQRNAADRNQNFSQFLKTDDVEALKKRREDILRLVTPNAQNVSLVSATKPAIEDGKMVLKANESYQTLRRELLEIDARIRQVPIDRNAQSLKSFEQNNEAFKKSQLDAIEYEKKRGEETAKAEKKRLEDVEKGIEKVKELGKVYRDTFDGLNARLNANNPIALAFQQGKKELDLLKESLRGLSPELQNQALAIQNKLNADALFNARLDNDFAAFDLKERANDLRGFKTPKIDDTDKFFKEFINDALKSAIAANGGSIVRFNRLGSGGFSQSSIESEVTNSFDRVTGFDGGFGGFSVRQKTFADLSEKEKLNFLNRDNVGAQNRLNAAFDLANNRRALNDDQRSSIDRRILALTNGLRPDQLTDKQRDAVAAAAENEAKRKVEKEDKGLKVQEEIEKHLKKLREIAEKGGAAALNVVIQDQTKNGAKISTAPRATPADTQRQYNPSTVSDKKAGKLTNL